EMPTTFAIHHWCVCWPSTGDSHALVLVIRVRSGPVADRYQAVSFEQSGMVRTTCFLIFVVSHDEPKPNLLPQAYAASLYRLGSFGPAELACMLRMSLLVLLKTSSEFALGDLLLAR